MSQKKVDAYKERKAHRAEIMRREKRVRRVEATLLVVILAALIGWFGFAVYRQVQSNKETVYQTTEVRTGAIDDYMEELESLTSEDPEEEAEGADEVAEEAEEAAAEAEAEAEAAGTAE